MYLNKMKRNAIKQLVLLDFIAAALAWFCFWIYRQHLLTGASYEEALQKLHTKDYVNMFLVVPAGWVLAYLLSGTYFDLYRKSRLNEINRTLISCILGCIMVSVIVFANDSSDYSYFINEFGH